MAVRDESEIAQAELSVRNSLSLTVIDSEVGFGKQVAHVCLLWVLKHPDGDSFGELLTTIREIDEMSDEEIMARITGPTDPPPESL